MKYKFYIMRPGLSRDMYKTSLNEFHNRGVRINLDWYYIVQIGTFKFKGDIQSLVGTKDLGKVELNAPVVWFPGEVIEFEDEDGHLVHFWYEKYSGWLQFHPETEKNLVNSIANEIKQNESIVVLDVPLHEKPYVTEMPGELSYFDKLLSQKASLMAVADDLCIIHNDNADSWNRMNRYFGEKTIRGRFFICGLANGKDLCSLTNKQIEKYYLHYEIPEIIGLQEINNKIYMGVLPFISQPANLENRIFYNVNICSGMLDYNYLTSGNDDMHILRQTALHRIAGHIDPKEPNIITISITKYCAHDKGLDVNSHKGLHDLCFNLPKYIKENRVKQGITHIADCKYPGKR